MAYPGALPSFIGFTSSHTLAADSHAAQHNLEQSEIVAIATKVGTGASTPTSGMVLRGNGVGTSTWGQVALTTDVTGVLPVVNGGTGQGTLTGLTLPSAILTSSPTLTTPVIADFSTATHNHSSNATGGASLAPTSLTTNVINASGANHIALSAGTNKLVKTTVLRQDDTANTYQVGNTIILTGWGVMTPGVASSVSETVNFGVTFLQRPIVTISGGGDNASALTYGSGSIAILGLYAEVSTVTTASFIAFVASVTGANWGANNTVFYHWTAIGEI